MTTTTTETLPRQTAEPMSVMPRTLPDYRDAVLSLRKQQAAFDRSDATVVQMAAQLEAAQAAVEDLSRRQAARLLAAFAKGLDELSDTDKRAFQDEQRQLFGLTRDFAVTPEDLPALREELHAKRAELGARWESLRITGRELGLQGIESNVDNVLTALDDPRAQVCEIAEHLESLRDLCAAHDKLRNQAAGRAPTRIELDLMPDLRACERMVFEDRDQLAVKLGLSAILKRWAPIAEVSPEADEAKVAQIVGSFCDTFLIAPYTHQERKLERVAYVSPSGQVRIRKFKEDQGASWDVASRVAMEKRLAELEAAEAELRTIRQQPI